MKSLKHILVIFAIVLLGSIAAAAQTQQTHTVQRGESLESIAAKYGVTTQAIREANPQMSAIYVGYKVIIPQAAQTRPAESGSSYTRPTQVAEPARDYSSATAPVQDSPAYEEHSDEKEFSPNDFSNFYLTYSGEFQAFDKGAYGIGGMILTDTGFGFEYSLNYNYGIVKNYEGRGQIYKIGPVYGYAFNKHLMIYTPLQAHLTVLESATGAIDRNGDLETKMKFNGGITLGPGIAVKFGRIVLSTDVELGWMNGYKKLYTAVSFHLGFDI